MSSKMTALKSGTIAKFEHIVVIPVYNECVEDVLRMIHSVAVQQSVAGLAKPRAIVLNINNSTAESKDANSVIYTNNLTVFTFMQKLIEGDVDVSSYYVNTSPVVMERMVRAIRDSLMAGHLYIKLIDSFSLGHARAHNTLGFAREFATRYAVNHIAKDENSLLFSTDADCIFATQTMSETDRMFTEYRIDLTPLNMDYHFHNLDWRACQSAIRYRLSRLLVENLINLSTSFSIRSKEKTTNSILLKNAFNVGGAFTVIRAGKYAKSLGYPDDFKEDLYIVANIKKVGGVIGDLRKMYPRAVVYTSPRVSDRVPSGYGTKIASFSRDERDFFKYQVTDINAHLDIVACVRSMEEKIEDGQDVNMDTVLAVVNDKCPWMDGSLKDGFVQDLEDIFSNNPFDLYNDAHWNLSNKTKRLLRSKLLPQQTIRDQIELLESAYDELGLNLLQIEKEQYKEQGIQNFLDYQSFKRRLFNAIEVFPGLDIDHVLAVANCSVANSYMQLYIPEFRELLVDAGQDDLGINRILEKCEARLLEAIIYGYKSELSSEIETSLFKHLGSLEH